MTPALPRWVVALLRGVVPPRTATQAIADLDDDDLTLDGMQIGVGDGQGVPHGFGVLHQDVQLGRVAVAGERGGCQVHTGVADSCGELGQLARQGPLQPRDHVHGLRRAGYDRG